MCSVYTLWAVCNGVEVVSEGSTASRTPERSKRGVVQKDELGQRSSIAAVERVEARLAAWIGRE